MSEPESNMRRLKRIPGDDGLTFTLETAADREKDNLLCNFCAWRDKHGDMGACVKHRVLKRFAKDGIGLLIRTCETYQPVLTFRITKAMAGGFDEKFNTFRLGTTWYNRVSPGNIVGLYDVAKKEIFGKAIVIGTYNGDMEEMCFDHAQYNHTCLGLDQEAAAERMGLAMRGAYGHIMQHRKNTLTTVIDMQRIT